MNDKVTFFSTPGCFYYKGDIHCDQNLVYVAEPKSLAGLIPAGKRAYTVQANQIAMVNTKFNIRGGELFGGLFFVLLGSMIAFGGKDFVSFLVSLIFYIPALIDFAGCLEMRMYIRLSAGSYKTVRFSIFNKEKAKEAEALILDTMNNCMYDPNVAMQNMVLQQGMMQQTMVMQNMNQNIQNMNQNMQTMVQQNANPNMIPQQNMAQNAIPNMAQQNAVPVEQNNTQNE